MIAVLYGFMSIPMAETNHQLAGACSVERAFAIIGGAWTFLVLREALLFRVRRFDQFCANLGIARASLDKTLTRLVHHGVMERRPLKSAGRRMGYFPTAMGEDLLAPLVAAKNWGDQWCLDELAPRREVWHTACGHALQGNFVCSACHEPIRAREVSFAPASGRAFDPAPPRHPGYGKNRYVPAALLERMGPCAIARTMAAIGDPWSFLILRECFYGVRRFDEFRRHLAIAPNILSVRLKRFLAEGILVTRPIPGRPHQAEYRLSEKGMQLYNLPVSVIAWGDRWLAGPEGPPLILTHNNCGQVFSAELRCGHCGDAVIGGEARLKSHSN